MSLLPFILQDLVDSYEGNRRMPYIHDQHFGLGLLDDYLASPHHQLLRQEPARSGYIRPWRNLAAGDSGVSTVASNKNEFRVNLDVQQFKPEELKVKVEDGFIVIDGKHEERQDQHGFVSRQFTRKYKLPEDIDEAKLTSTLSSDGVLSLTAPKIIKEAAAGREIPIIHTNQPAVKGPKQQKNDDKKPEENMES